MPIDTTMLAQLRKLIDEADDSGGWTDVALTALAELYLNAEGGYNLRGAASWVWEAKAAEAAKLVDVSESGSSRSMSQEFKHALDMAKRLGEDSSSETDDTTPAPRSMRIVRATPEV